MQDLDSITFSTPKYGLHNMQKGMQIYKTHVGER